MDEYFYLDSAGKQQGPVCVNQFTHLGITKNTWVWKNGMPGWQIAGTLPALFPFLLPTPPPRLQPAFTPPHAKPDSLLVWSLLSTVLCCPPLGILAVVHSTRVDSLWNKGDYEAATKEAQSAKIWCIVSGISGFFFGLIAFFSALASNY